MHVHEAAEQVGSLTGVYRQAIQRAGLDDLEDIKPKTATNHLL